MTTVSVFMDVEDPINPLADDAALDFARLFTEAGVRGSFCLTGDKCRTLLERGRHDIGEAFAPHCLGLHTNGHSRHPTTMELLAEVGFEEGCALAYQEELNGFEAFHALFGRVPAFWGGAGNTWSPEITDALERLHIPAYAYALTSLPGDAVHRFNGLFALPQALSISETDWMDDDRAEQAIERVFARIDAGQDSWLGIFVGHPTKMRYVDYWDKGYYAGRTPPEPEFADPGPDALYERAQTNLSRFLQRLKAEATILGVDETLALPWTFRPPTPEELTFFGTTTARHLRAATKWPPHRPDLEAENIVAKTLALTNTLEVGTL